MEVKNLERALVQFASRAECAQANMGFLNEATGECTCCLRTCTHKHTRMDTHTQTHMHGHTRAHTHSHANTHTRTHSLSAGEYQCFAGTVVYLWQWSRRGTNINVQLPACDWN